MIVADADERAFTRFVETTTPRLRRALVAAYGPDRGGEAVAEALAYAWEHWEDVSTMDNPAGYLYRVGQSRTRPRLRVPAFPPPPASDAPQIEPGLPAALDSLSEPQRIAVVLVHGFGWTHAEVADVTGVARTTVQNHLDRGLAKVRAELGATDHA